MDILRSTCDEAGYNKDIINSMTEKLMSEGVDLHSLLLAKNGSVCYEEYYGKAMGGTVEGGPNSAASMHRMYSVTKSLVAIAIGLLVDEGRISLDDRIVDYYELLAKNSAERYKSLMKDGLHNAGCESDEDSGCSSKWLPQSSLVNDDNLMKTTIEDMLTMRTCHQKTTYKVDLSDDWVASFFNVPSDKEPGHSFNYDTSASHVLGALVEAITNMDIMDYVRIKMPELGISPRAHILYDPFGCEVGGSGLMCTPQELYRLGRLIELKGNVDGRQLLSASYIEHMTSKLVDNSPTAKLAFEGEGYGYYTWRTHGGGYMFYGMMGQLVWFDPENDFMAVTTADTSSYPGDEISKISKGSAGGVQRILNFLEDVVVKARAVKKCDE